MFDNQGCAVLKDGKDLDAAVTINPMRGKNGMRVEQNV